MKTLVLTIAIGQEYKELACLTHPSLRAYASRIGADFFCIDFQEISKTTPHWEKFQIATLLETYDRILYLDTDIIVRNDCQSLFDIVPEDQLGMFNEAQFTYRSREMMVDVCRSYGTMLPSWDGRYFNSMDSITGEDRLASYIVHYAGCPNIVTMLPIVENDLHRWASLRGQYTFKRHIHIQVTGGLGDQVNAEPAIRYMQEYVYPGEDITLTSHWPELFRHLGLPVFQHGQFVPQPDTPYYICNSLPAPDTPTWAVLSNLLCHTVDYCSTALLRRLLPITDKRVYLKSTCEDLASLVALMGAHPIDKLVVIHAGRHWASKTFPEFWWQAIVDDLAEHGVTVCLIGQDDASTVPHDPRGVLPLTCPPTGLDLRTKLSLLQLIALLKYARVLISNDSSPIHIAGAFDNWILLIPSCKHPEHVLPYRHGSVWWKASALYKQLTLDDVSSQPTEVHGSNADFIVEDWSVYLPDVSDVVKEALDMLEEK